VGNPLNEPFHGSKVAVLCDNKLLVYRRDNFDHILYPGQLDFPGGGREGDESPLECARRELDEEFALDLPETRFIYERRYDQASRTVAWFFVANIFPQEIEQISFGDEGQYWQLTSIDAYLAHAEGISILKSRLRDYLESNA
jgi:8-oxo-dGTP diphosphatase